VPAAAMRISSLEIEIEQGDAQQIAHKRLQVRCATIHLYSGGPRVAAVDQSAAKFIRSSEELSRRLGTVHVAVITKFPSQPPTGLSD
jgi:hypothetical protein